MEINNDEVGELVPTEYFSASDSDIQAGDHVFFKLVHDAFRHDPQWPELVGEVLAVVAGHEIVYLVKVLTAGVLTWPDRFVRRCHVTKVFIPDWR